MADDIKNLTWYVDKNLSEDVIYAYPKDLYVHTISCIEEYHDGDKGGIRVKSKNYYFRIKPKT